MLQLKWFSFIVKQSLHFPFDACLAWQKVDSMYTVIFSMWLAVCIDHVDCSCSSFVISFARLCGLEPCKYIFFWVRVGEAE